MFYDEYLQKRMMMDKLTKRLEEKRKLQNKPVTIKNLVVFPKDADSYGESKAYFVPSSNINMVRRLIDHVKFLSQIANLHHQQTYCELADDGQYQLKKEHHDTITRLSLSEFSLYGKKPLTMDQFNRVVTSIRLHAKKMHENVHLLLSSFSVINEDKKILNVSLYVQSGEDPKIDVITKAVASTIDVQYPNSTRFSRQMIGQTTPEVSAFIAGSNTISNNSILEITTKGGGKFLQTIDVCFDHVNQHSKKLLGNQIDAMDLRDIGTHDLLPEQLDQIVTSNSLNLESNAKIGYSVLHIDPRPEICFDRENRRRPIDTTSTLSAVNVNSLQKYTKTNIVSEPGKLTVTQPPFGPDYHIKVYQEQQVSSFGYPTQDTIKVINDHIIKQQVNRRVNFSSESLAGMNQIESTNVNAYILANKLIIQLEEKCKPTWFEKIFRTASYTLKLNAQAIIAESAFNLNELQKIDKQCMFLAHASPWSRNMKFEWNNLTRFPNDFLKKLDDMVDIFQSTVETERPADIHTYR